MQQPNGLNSCWPEVFWNTKRSPGSIFLTPSELVYVLVCRLFTSVLLFRNKKWDYFGWFSLFFRVLWIFWVEGLSLRDEKTNRGWVHVTVRVTVWKSMWVLWMTERWMCGRVCVFLSRTRPHTVEAEQKDVGLVAVSDLMVHLMLCLLCTILGQVSVKKKHKSKICSLALDKKLIVWFRNAWKYFSYLGGHNPVVTKLGRFSGRIRARTHIDSSIVDSSLITSKLGYTGEGKKGGRIC